VDGRMKIWALDMVLRSKNILSGGQNINAEGHGAAKQVLLGCSGAGFGRGVVLCAGLGFVLAGCASGGATTAKLTEHATPAEFTTIGKPTKTIKTPNGPVEVYDPSQDSEVRAAFKKLYNKRAKYFSRHPKLRLCFSHMDGWENRKFFHNKKNKKLAEILAKAERAQTYDYMRAQCKGLSDYQYPDWRINRFTSSCPVYDWGSSELSVCEKQVRFRRSKYDDVPISRATCMIDRANKSPQDEDYRWFFIGEIGQKYHGDVGKQFELFFYKTCKKW